MHSLGDQNTEFRRIDTEGGQLTERIRRRPYAVVLLDELNIALRYGYLDLETVLDTLVETVTRLCRADMSRRPATMPGTSPTSR